MLLSDNLRMMSYYKLRWCISQMWERDLMTRYYVTHDLPIPDNHYMLLFKMSHTQKYVFLNMRFGDSLNSEFKMYGMNKTIINAVDSLLKFLL